jgi:hypothetical protein
MESEKMERKEKKRNKYEKKGEGRDGKKTATK